MYFVGESPFGHLHHHLCILHPDYNKSGMLFYNQWNIIKAHKLCQTLSVAWLFFICITY